uniref:Uncharacterized protein n=1 Tax=Oryza brachyantha TaxID=4533 RepID=J3MPC7_ORYBR
MAWAITLESQVKSSYRDEQDEAFNGITYYIVIYLWEAQAKAAPYQKGETVCEVTIPDSHVSTFPKTLEHYRSLRALEEHRRAVPGQCRWRSEGHRHLQPQCKNTYADRTTTSSTGTSTPIAVEEIAVIAMASNNGQ